VLVSNAMPLKDARANQVHVDIGFRVCVA
jgi:hypothetical protein